MMGGEMSQTIQNTLIFTTTEAAKPPAFSLFECDLFAVTLQLSERVCQRLSSAGASGWPSFWNLDPSWAQSNKTSRVPFHLFLLKRSFGFLYFSTQWQQQPPSQGDKFMFLFLSTRKPTIWEAFAIYSWIHGCCSCPGPHGVHFKHSSQTSIFLLFFPLEVLSIIRHECNHDIRPL